MVSTGDAPPESAAGADEGAEKSPAEQLAALTARFSTAHDAAANAHKAGAAAAPLLVNGSSAAKGAAQTAARGAAAQYLKGFEEALHIVTLVRTLQTRATAKPGAEAKSADVETALSADGKFAVAVKRSLVGALAASFERAKTALATLSLMGERFLNAAALVLSQKHHVLVNNATVSFGKRLGDAKAALDAYATALGR